MYVGNPYLLAEMLRRLTLCSFVHKTRTQFFVGFLGFFGCVLQKCAECCYMCRLTDLCIVYEGFVENTSKFY